MNGRNRRSLDSTTDAAGHCWCLSGTISVHLHTECDCLTWLDTAIPTQIGCGVRIRTGQSGIPATGDPVVDIIPANTPAINCRRTGVGNFNAGSSPTTPIIGDLILATGRLCQRALRGKYGRDQKQFFKHDECPRKMNVMRVSLELWLTNL